MKYNVAEVYERIIDRCIFDKTTDCWLWQGYTDKDGYGTVRVGDKMRRVHRVMWAIANGRIPKRHEPDHLCPNRHCCNPAHMEIVTHAENARRGNGVINNHCKNGHELSGWNRMPDGKNIRCRTCYNDWMREYRASKRGW